MKVIFSLLSFMWAVHGQHVLRGRNIEIGEDIAAFLNIPANIERPRNEPKPAAPVGIDNIFLSYFFQGDDVASTGIIFL